MKYLLHCIPSIFVALSLTVVLCAQGRKACHGKNIKEPLSVIKAVAPVFPRTAIATSSSGKVIVEIRVNGTGVVTSAKAVEGHPLLLRSSENAAKKWQFKQTEIAETLLCLTFVYTVVPKDALPEEIVAVFSLPYQIEVKSFEYDPIVHSDPRMDRSNTRE